jgi:hypothetical protein
MNADTSNPSSKPNSPSNHKVHFVWGSVFIATCALIVFVAKAFHDTLKEDIADVTSKFEEYAGKAKKAAVDIAEKFKTGTITTTFKTESPIFELIKAGRLEVAVKREQETFKRENEQTYFWDLFNPGKTISEIRVPATFRYHLDMDKDWKIEVKDNSCIVHAPALEPSLPVAFETDQMEKESAQGWARFDGVEQMDKLEKGITSTLNARAKESKKMDVARAMARDVVARFVRRWLLNSDQWQKDRFTSITVIFANDEKVELKPTLTIDVVP